MQSFVYVSLEKTKTLTNSLHWETLWLVFQLLQTPGIIEPMFVLNCCVFVLREVCHCSL